MNWTAIASCLGVSPKTLHRRRIEYGIADTYSDITNQELEWNIRDILRLTPVSGETYVRGALRARGIHIQRWKVMEAFETIAPVNRAIRRRYAIQRRLYNASLNEFVNQWNHHGLRTMHSISPLALWYSEVIEIGVTGVNIGDITLYGIDPDGPVGDIETENMVVVPESTINLTENQVSV
ncbi:Hypothetical predicted protein [Paramuricea clavata]|uniref:Integrase core domain-containing protein n=1 Tax=Paramuricea clavata TaxID=317549 RepID=A0A7D9HBJ0_PARCT|nr:Hypothetical predicted protein [Paramuricea clavata]